MSVKEGDRYRNTSGVTQYAIFPPDAVAFVRQVDPNDQDAAHYGTLVLEWDDGSGMGVAAGLTEVELSRDWERVDG